MADVIFRTEGITKVYETGDVRVFALDGVDLSLYKGELTVLLGPSGSGKSTLLNILGGLDHASDGRVWFGETELTNLPDRGLTRYRRDHVGFVFQFYNLVPSLTARENVQPCRSGQAHGSFSVRVVRGRAAARRHRPRHCQTAGNLAVR